MNGYIANTDYEWYRFLEGHPELDEVNFWLPKDTRNWHAIPVSERLRQDYSNGRSYYPLRGKEIYKPGRPELLPDRALLEWHNNERFLG